MAAHTYIHYFIPYDGDVEDHPNVFIVKRPIKSVTLGDVQEAFPLPGTYFYRAKQPYGKTHVWLDLHSAEEAVPAFNGKVVLKVSRLSNAVAPTSATTTSSAAKVPQQSPTTAPSTAAKAVERPAAPAPATAAARKPAAESADMLGLFDSPSSTASNQPIRTPTSSSVPADIFSVAPGVSPTGAATMPPMAPQASFDAFSSVGWGSTPAQGPASPYGTIPAGRGMPLGAQAGPRPLAARGPIGGPIGGAPAQAQQPPKPASKNLLDGDIFSM